jgi:16S rRNA C1402 (ribose-2'-O) methylase RsmI
MAGRRSLAAAVAAAANSESANIFRGFLSGDAFETKKGLFTLVHRVRLPICISETLLVQVAGVQRWTPCGCVT